ncbi:hypothetical protein [Clostridium kluyveri]|nr:hypothetical protein [Clostridium kluyveri]
MPRKRTIEELKQKIKETTHCELLSTKYVNRKTKMKFRCECGNKFENTLMAMEARNKQYCNECSNKLMHDKFVKTQEEFEKELCKVLGEEYVALTPYKNINSKITVKHLECDYTWNVRPSSILHQHCKCPKCYGNNMKKTTRQFKLEVYNLVGDEFYVLGEYKSAKIPILIKHNVCGNAWEVEPTNFLTNKACVFCSPRSKGEDKIANILNDKHILYEREKRFNDCIGKRKLPFDFYLPDYNIVIEYDGIQHFKPSFNKKEFKNIKINDETKNNYCKDNNIKLLRIPYWEFNNIETILESALN